ncbi:MAG: hypothetical protein AB7T86_01540 [Xanthobacteraceae bacterium]|uniref:hypothetical protein n=1 Tax=Pseudolabrys sp. TaxID=1960880 RepID=UPI003D0ECB35
MALLDGLLGGGILGGGDSASESHNSNDLGGVIGTNPQFGLGASDILHSESSDDDGDHSSFTGIGDLGIGLAAPTLIGVQASSDSSDAQVQDNDSGGLLGGLL